jgi:hypothetical protein
MEELHNAAPPVTGHAYPCRNGSWQPLAWHAVDGSSTRCEEVSGGAYDTQEDAERAAAEAGRARLQYPAQG